MGFKPHYDFCKCHNQRRLIVVRAGLCAHGNEELKKAKKKAEGKKYAKYQFRKEPTGEQQVFADIAEEREWKCQVTGERLPYLTASNFLHVLPKALNKYPLMKLYPKNIIIATGLIHFKWDKTPRASLTETYWKSLFELEAQLKKEYSELKETERKLKSHRFNFSITDENFYIEPD